MAIQIYLTFLFSNFPTYILFTKLHTSFRQVWSLNLLVRLNLKCEFWNQIALFLIRKTILFHAKVPLIKVPEKLICLRYILFGQYSIEINYLTTLQKLWTESLTHTRYGYGRYMVETKFKPFSLKLRTRYRHTISI